MPLVRLPYHNRSILRRLILPASICLFAALTAGGVHPPAAQAAPVKAVPSKSAPTALPLADKQIEKARLQILTPNEGAVLPPGKALIIGRSPSEGKRVDLIVNGSAAGNGTVERGGFSVFITLASGKNTITARSGGQETVVAVTVGANPDYVRHPPVEKCISCHPATDKTFQTQGPKDKVCYRCHQRKDRRKAVHGPMGAGECTACHDPHGSSHKALTVAEPQALCALCHDQKSSEQHIRLSQGKTCIQCHDPHASDKPFHQK